MSEFKCLICGNTKYRVIKEHTRDSEHRVVECSKGCGLHQLFPLPSLQEDEKYYNENSHDKKITPDFDIDQLFQKFYYQNKSRIDYLKAFGIASNNKILDFACGYGFFIEMLEKEGYIADGIEISEDRLAICEKRLGKGYSRIRNINLQKDNLPEELEEKYDVVTMIHVLEHLIEPKEVLEKINRLLKPGGLLVIEVPNEANLMMEISKEFNDFFYIRDHVAYYTPSILCQLVKDCGYEVLLNKGNQVYGLINHMNWIINGTPQYKMPSWEICEPMKWLEEYYRKEMNESVRAEYMYVIAKKVDNMGNENKCN